MQMCLICLDCRMNALPAHHTKNSARTWGLTQLLLLSGLFTAAPVRAEGPVPAEPVEDLPSLQVDAEGVDFVQAPFLPDVQGTQVYAGKKTTVIDLDALPKISGSNYRQALIQTPGLVLSEESTPLISIGYRGLEPHRVQYTQVLKDGVPIHADQFGYPEAYYVPPLETVDRIEFVRGGASLMYGPQPGGALNYVTHRPRTDRALGAGTENTFGPDSTWNSFNYVEGTTGRIGYYGYYDHRETEGFRAANSDVTLDAATVKLALNATTNDRWLLTLDTYRDEHGEPGGLTFAPGTNAVLYSVDREASSRLFDRFVLERNAATLSWEHDFQQSSLTSNLWVVDYTRYSRRQRGGGFGTLPTGAASNTNDIENQEFLTFGWDTRYRLDWGQLNRHTLATGVQLYHTDSPRTDTRGAAPDATTGVVFRESDREIFYAPVFAENRFAFGDFSVTPGVRVESYRQTVETRFFDATTGLPDANTPRREATDDGVNPLLGLGMAYKLAPTTEVYSNLSQSYRPPLFTESVPNSTTNLVAGDLEEGRAWQTDFGVRTDLDNGFTADVSVFYMEFSDKIGGAGTAADPIRNIGKIEYLGLESAASYDLFHPFEVGGGQELNLMANLTLLDAEITEDANAARVGNSPQYAPDYVVRTGLVYTAGRGKKVALLGTFVDDSFADDANSATRLMPAYMVWDLTTELQIPGTPVTFLAGINNLFDEDYYARVRNDGIDPAPTRTLYVGFRAEY